MNVRVITRLGRLEKDAGDELDALTDEELDQRIIDLAEQLAQGYVADGVPKIIDPKSGKMDLAAMGFEDLKISGFGPGDAEWHEHQSLASLIKGSPWSS